MGYHIWNAASFVFLILSPRLRLVLTARDVPEWFVTYKHRALTNVMSTRQVPSPVACCAECAETSTCVAADFTASANIGMCRLSERDPVHKYPGEMTSATGSRVFVKGYIATATCGSDWVKRGEFCYTYLAASVDFPNAKQNCLDKDSHLAYINSVEENVFITDTVAGGKTPFWIGIEDVKPTSNVWTVGHGVTFTHYGPEEPNFLEGEVPYCMEIMNVDGEWNDVPCSKSVSSVCKKHLYL